MRMHDNFDYQKAVPISDTESIVYAYQYTEADGFDDLPFLGKGCLVEIVDIHLIQPNDWEVWYPKTIEYEILSDQEFRDRFILYDDCPPAIQAKADKHPAHAKWVEECNKQAKD